MSVRQALLALLEEGPMYGYQLRSEFERRTGATWPLNVGQVYTTLTRLERDGLVTESGADGEGHVVYEVTEAGRDEVATWFTTPVGRTTPPRDELAIKLALAVTVPGVDVGTVIQQQRSATISALQDYTRLKRDRDDSTPQRPGLGPGARVAHLQRRGRGAVARPLRGPPPPRRRSRRPARDRSPDHRLPLDRRTGEDRSMSTVLQLDTVTRIHGEGETEVHALTSVTFAAHAGELVAVMGPSGSGKSTLLTLAGGLDAPTSGTVSVEGTDLATLGQKGRARMRRTSIGYVFQDFNLIPALTAAENVSLPLRARRGRQPSGPGAGADGAGRGRASPSSPTGSRTTCPVASSSGWRSPGRSSASGG